MKAVLDRPIEGEWPYLWIDATYLKVRRGGRIVSVAVIIAVGVNTDGRREVLGMEINTQPVASDKSSFRCPCQRSRSFSALRLSLPLRLKAFLRRF